MMIRVLDLICTLHHSQSDHYEDSVLLTPTAPTCARARPGAGPVDCRKVRVEGNMWVKLCAGSPRSVPNNRSAASAAMSEMGCRIVVSAGQTWLASGESSNPTTDTSSGTPSPML